MDDTAAVEAQRALLDAGAVLASIADTSRDLCDFASDFSEIALSLQCLGRGLEDADERASQEAESAVKRDQLWALRPEPADILRKRVEAAELRKSRDTAIRTAKRALVDLARVVAEMEREP